ncbi:MAG TPA: ornithine cyclodeaminase family protein, partial [Pseudonocardiaceae bacterium]
GRATGAVPWIGAEQVAALPMAEAVAALAGALRDGLDVAGGPPRVGVPTTAGQLLLMPAEGGERVGVKVVSVAPGNPARDLPLVQAVYVLLDGPTLTPVALLDGTALTALRTPAVSAVAADRLAAPDAARLVVFGCGTQAWGHVQALRAIRPLREVVAVGRDPGRMAAFAAGVTELGLAARPGTPADVAEADLVVCATTAGRPLFDGTLVRPGTCVLAVGTHERHRRELDGHLLARSTVVVEDLTTALREAGDIVLAVEDGSLDPAHLHSLTDLVAGRVTRTPTRPAVFKSVGMAWQDLVIATELHRRL